MTERVDTLQEAIAAAGEMTLPIEGRSMGDRWARAERVRVVSCARSAPRWGCVVLIRRGERVYAHRLLAKLGNRFWTKGDARLAWDRPLARAGEVIGVVVGLLPEERPVLRSRIVAARELMRALMAWPFLSFIRRLRGSVERLPA